MEAVAHLVLKITVTPVQIYSDSAGFLGGSSANCSFHTSSDTVRAGRRDNNNAADELELHRKCVLLRLNIASGVANS